LDDHGRCPVACGLGNAVFEVRREDTVDDAGGREDGDDGPGAAGGAGQADGDREDPDEREPRGEKTTA
jgi:hypothetical protein